MKEIAIMWLILAAVLLAISGCATFEPDDGRHFSPPTFHFEPYQPKQPENPSNSYTVLVSDRS